MLRVQGLRNSLHLVWKNALDEMRLPEVGMPKVNWEP